MAKVTINDEMFDFDTQKRPMTEALALEEALHCNYVQWEADMQAGSAKALAGYVWMVWRRNGREVPIEDILNGTVEVDVAGLKIEADEGETDPTNPNPDPLSSTAAATPARSAKSSASGRGKSGS